MKIFFTNFFYSKKANKNRKLCKSASTKVQKSKLIQGHHKKSVGSETWIQNIEPKLLRQKARADNYQITGESFFKQISIICP